MAPRNEEEAIYSNLDLELMRQQLTARVCDLDEKINWIISVMQRSCAPIRDNEVESIHNCSRLSEKLECIVDVLQDMAIDLANVQLRALRPHLLPIAIEYGRSKFEEAIAADPEAQALPNTKQWLQEAYNRLLSNNSTSNVLTTTNPNPTHEAIFQDAFIHLLLSSKSAAEWAPETLRLDIARLVRFQNTAQAITIVAALLTLARNFGIVDEDEHAVLAETLFKLLEDHNTSPQHLAAEIERRVDTMGGNTKREEMIRTMVDKTLSHNDAIYALLSRRVASVLKSYLATRDMAAPTALYSYGLRHVSGPLQGLCEHVHVLADYHYRMHEQRYFGIINQMM